MTTEREPGARLSAYMRYAALVAEQVRALEEGAVDRFRDLALRREEIQQEVDARSGPGSREPEEPLPEEVGARLQWAAGLDRHILRRLDQLRSETREALRNVERRGGQARKYLEGVETGLSSSAGLDLKT